MATSVGIRLQAIVPSRNTQESAWAPDSLPLPASFARDFVAGASCFRQADRDRLPAAPDPPAGASAAELAALHFVQRPSNLDAARAAVPACHGGDLLVLPGHSVPYLSRSLTRRRRSGCRRAIASGVGRVSRPSDGSH